MAPEGVGVVDNGGVPGAASGSNTVPASTTPSSTEHANPGTPAPSPKWEDDPRVKGLIGETQKERKARQTAETERGNLQARLEERERQIAALTNSKPPSQAELDAAEIRQRFSSVVPKAALLEMLGLTEDDLESVKSTKTLAAQVKEATEHRWTEHSKGMLSKVQEKIAAEVGDLTDKQIRRINALYIAEADANPEFMQRHDAGDKTLIDEFVKGYLDDLVEPVRRKLTATEASRYRPVPNGGNRNLPAVGGKPIDVKDDKAVMDFIMESRRGKFAK